LSRISPHTERGTAASGENEMGRKVQAVKAEEVTATITAIKGFNADLQCSPNGKPFQFEVGTSDAVRRGPTRRRHGPRGRTEARHKDCCCGNHRQSGNLPEEVPATITAIKGFNADLQCSPNGKPFQFEVGTSDAVRRGPTRRRHGP